jgi:sugar phosphate isomerase/epimerase/transposase
MGSYGFWAPDESKLVEEALGNSFLDELPTRLIGDKAYDSDSLDRDMEEQCALEMIAPHRCDRAHPTQDGRSLRRYRRRWTVEHLFAWLQWFRRLVTRWEYHVGNFLGMVRLGCMKIMLMTRKQFFETSALGLAAIVVSRRGAFGSPFGLPVGLQPYTVRNEMKKDFEGTLRKVADMGYKEIELSLDFYGQPPQRVRRVMDSLGLATPSCHYPTPKDDSEWEKSVEHARSFGVRYMGTGAPVEWRRSLDGWRKTADLFNHLGQISRRTELHFAYHNHNWEFISYNGTVGYDELLRRTDPGLVKLELDCFWATAAGRDPVDYFNKYPGRFPLLHIKDLKPGYQPSTGPLEGNPFIEVGSGVIDWKRLFKAAPNPAAGRAHC